MSTLQKYSAAGLISLVVLCQLANAQQAETSQEVSKTKFEKAIAETTPIFQARLRYEAVEQDNALLDAEALTYRFRAGLKTGEVWDTTFLIEFDHVEDILDDFNSDPTTVNPKTGVFSVVPDPNATELNRLQLVNKSLPDTTITLGRQRLILDDSRFVGNVGWRQNEQTFDGLRVQNSSLGDLSIDLTYLNRVNRIFGDDSNGGEWEGDSYLVNLSYPTPIGKLTGFAYFVDVDNAGGIFSSQTIGARLGGKKDVGTGSLAYVASLASQTDYGSSNLDYRSDFVSLDAAYSINGVSAGVGYELLGADEQRAFQTPLATLHKFNGWADVFLNTPNTGLKDIYVKAAYAPGDIGLFNETNFQAVYHDFEADRGGSDYGSELNLVASAKIDKVRFMLKFADYNSDEFAVDTQKFWIQLNYAF